MTPAIAFEGVAKRYGTVEVLKDVSLAVPEGQFTALTGVNGAGKTTLIKCLLDFTRPSAGRISIHGVPQYETASRAKLAFLPEKFTPPYYLAGADFLRYLCSLYGVALEQARVRELAAVLDLDVDALAKPVRALSKGTAQKLGLLACLLSDRPLLVMDEPMSGLDPKARAYFKQHLEALRKQGRTVFFSTHLLNDVEALCDQVAVLHGGRLAFAGSPAECVRSHNTANFEQAYLRCIS